MLLAHGPRWLPPAMPTATITQKTAAQRGGEGKVSPEPRQQFLNNFPLFIKSISPLMLAAARQRPLIHRTTNRNRVL